MNPYTDLPLETLTEALAKAQAALPVLSRGEAVGTIRTTDESVTLMPTTPEALMTDIGYLRQAITALQNPNAMRRRYAVARFPQC